MTFKQVQALFILINHFQCLIFLRQYINYVERSNMQSKAVRVIQTDHWHLSDWFASGFTDNYMIEFFILKSNRSQMNSWRHNFLQHHSCLLYKERISFDLQKLVFTSDCNKIKHNFLMSKAKTTASDNSRSVGLKRVGDLSAYQGATYELPLDARSESSKNSNETPSAQEAGFIHIQLGDHLRYPKNTLDVKATNKKRKRSYCEPGNALMIREVEEEDNNKLEVPETKAIRVRSQPFNQASQNSKKETHERKVEEPIRYQETHHEANPFGDYPYPSIQISQVERYAQYKDHRNKEKTSRQIKSSKTPSNPNVVIMKMEGSTHESRLHANLSSGKTKQHLNVISHDSSNLIFQVPDLPNASDLSSLEGRLAYLTSTVPANTVAEFDFRREKRCCYPFVNPQYSISLKTGDFVVNGQKQWGHLNSYYAISAGQERYGQKDESFLGHLEGNFLGSEFKLYQQSKELVAQIYYEPSISCCSSNYRKIQIYFKIPTASEASSKNEKSLKEQYSDVSNRDRGTIVRLVTKQPKWNEKHGVYILGFKGKSKVGSIKNMVLVEENKQEDYILMFCKTADHKFHLQVTHPMTPFIAMGILLSSFDFKLCSQ